MIRTQLILAYVLCATSLILAQQTGGRTDVFYDSGRNVVFAIASSAPDYNTQYYYRMPMTTYLTKKGLTQSLDAWGYGTGESGPGTTYTEAPAESGVEFTAMTYHKVAIEYQTYEVVPGCGSCNDWYDPYGYLSIASKGDPEDDGPTFSIWVWATPIIIARTLEEIVDLGESGGKLRPPGQMADFDVTVRSFIPRPWVYGPEPGCIGADGRQMIYNGNDRTYERMNFSVKTMSRVILLPDTGAEVPGTRYNYTGPTRRYEAATGLAPNGVTLYEDSVLHDCYKLDDRGYASTSDMHIDIAGSAASKFATARMYGSAGNPLTPPGVTPNINWDVTVQVSKANPMVPTYSILFTHDCFPAFEVYVGSQRIHEWTPTGYNPITDIAYCLSGFGAISGGPRSGQIF